MQLETHGSKAYLATAAGVLYVPGTLYLNEEYTNPHTKQIVAKALRVWVRLADAFDIDLAARALEGRWLTASEQKALKYLVFRPIQEIESMSDHAVRNIASAVTDKEPQDRKGAVQPNTAVKQIVGVADYLAWFHKKVLEPRMPVQSGLSEALRRTVETCVKDLKKSVGGTKGAHPHRIRSVPTERFLRIYSAVFLHAGDVFKALNGTVGSNPLRDRAMLLLAGEGLRPGAIGNIGLADFKWAGGKEPGYIVIKDNTARRSKAVSTGTPVQKGAASTQNYNSLITVSIWPTTAQAIREYIDSERSSITEKTLRNRSEGFLFLAEHGGPIGSRGTIAHVFKQAGRGLDALGLLNTDPRDPYHEGEKYKFSAYLLRHTAASLFYATKAKTMKADVVTDLMKMRFGWSQESGMPALYAQRAMIDVSSLTVEDYIESLLAEAAAAKNGQGATA